MLISLIVAMDENRGIGKEGTLPWRLSNDLKRFKSLTMGHTVVMGRKTYESIGRALPGRQMIILTRSPKYQVEGSLVSHSLGEALEMARQAGESEAFIIGGAEIFAQALPFAEKIYLTRVHARLECDTFFPETDWAEWQTIQEEAVPSDEKNQYATTFCILSRKSIP